MVNGLDLFKEAFANFTNQYILIGGTACTIAMDNVGREFRATKDLDIVLCAEALNQEFYEAFWEFVRRGQYQIQKNSSGEKQFYRFMKPETPDYPYMLELFSRTPDTLQLARGNNLTPIPIEDQVASLSAILLDEDYYTFLQSGKQIVNGLQIATPVILIPLKARTWLELSTRKANGESVDSKDIRKHKNDIFRLFAILDPEFNGPIPTSVKSDLHTFLEAMSAESPNLKALGLGSRTLASVTTTLEEIYKL